jgi:hypothetical protein
MGIALLSASVTGVLTSSLLGAESEIRDPAVAGPSASGPGAWLTRIQQVFDPATRTLSRRVYTIWDPEPSRDLDFVWTPDHPSSDKPGLINGTGHLVWRIKGKPSYDQSSVFAQYRGDMRNGRPHGYGSYLDNTALSYDGEWKAGLFHGRGTLKLPSGDEYVGSFRAGKANGMGRYIDVTGEMYEGPFAAGHRHGHGTTTLPTGRTYRSAWSNGKESEVSRLVRVAQGPGTRLPGGADDIRIAITLDKRLPPSSRTGTPEIQKGDLWYSVSNAASGLLIRPGKKRLMSMWKEGGEIQLHSDEENKNFDDFGVLSLVKGQLVPLNLIIEVQNRSPGPIQISGAFVNVDASTTDLQPALQMSQESAFGDTTMDGYYRPFYFVENFGWSAAKDATLQFTFVSPTNSARKSASKQTHSLGSLERSIKVDFEPHLLAAGVDVDALKRNDTEGFQCRSNTRLGCLREVKATGVFGPLTELLTLDEVGIVVGVSGQLEYVWEDHAGRAKKASSPFNIRLPLGALKTEVESGEGGAREVISKATQRLRLDATNYRIPISYAANVAAGRTSRLVLPIEAEKSSVHDFNIVIQLADGRVVRSRPINLLYYRPRWLATSAFARIDSDAQSDASWLHNYDLVGNDVRRIGNTDTGSCHGACEAEPLCRAYTFDNWNQWCFLKSAVSMMRYDPKNTSWLKPGTQRPGAASDPKTMERYRNKAFPGHGYMIRQQIDLDACDRLCAADENCVAFTFKKRTRDCYLFDHADEYSSSADADSGVKRQLPR